MKRLTQEEISIVDAQPKPVQVEGGWIYPDESTRIYSDRYTAICARANRIGAMFNCRPGYARWHQVRSRLSIWAVGFYPAVVREVPAAQIDCLLGYAHCCECGSQLRWPEECARYVCHPCSAREVPS